MKLVADGAFYRSLAEDANDTIVVFDGDGTIVYANTATERLMGVTPDHAIGTNIIDYLHPDEVERAPYTVAQLDRYPLGLANGAYLLRHANGSWIPVDITGSQTVREGRTMVIAHCRYSIAPQIEREVLLGLMNHKNLTDVLTPVLDSIAWREMGSHVAISWSDESGWHHVDTGLPEELCGSIDTAPWDRVHATGRAMLRGTLDGLDPDIAAVATAYGLAGYWIESVGDPDYEPCALITIWVAANGATPLVHDLGMTSIKSYVDVILQFTTQRSALAHAATHDPLTGLVNRKTLGEAMAATIGGGSVLFCDLDLFKPVNDYFGHAVGDGLLEVVAQRLEGVVRAMDVVARIGGDEFVIMCPGLDIPGTEALADRVMGVFETPFMVADHRIEIGASIGLARSEKLDAATISRADQAMYAAKTSGRGVRRWAQGDGPDEVEFTHALRAPGDPRSLAI